MAGSNCRVHAQNNCYWIWKEQSVRSVVTGYAGRHPLQVLITWWVSWLHHCKLSQSPCLQDRCWWTHPCCKHLSGISRSLSSPWESQSYGIFWPPPGREELRYEFTSLTSNTFPLLKTSLVKLSFQLGHLGWLLKFPGAVPEGCSWALAVPQGCSCLAPFGVLLFCSRAETEPVAPSAVQSWHRPLQAGRGTNHTAVGTSALLWLSQDSIMGFFIQSLYFPPCHLLGSGAVSCTAVSRHLLQPLPAHLIFTSLPPVSSAAPWDHGISEGNGVWLLPSQCSAAQTELPAQSPHERLKPRTVSGVNSTVELLWAVLRNATNHQHFLLHFPWNPPGFTLTMCSLGSRLQSAKVISLPSRNLRVETVTSSRLFSSISSGRGEFRYSSSFCRVFKRPRSKAAQKGWFQNQY